MALGLGLGLSRIQPLLGGGDPLAGIPFALRLQTHRGDNVPLGMYQDTACTVPAVTDGDAVAAWRDELSGSGFTVTQSDVQKRPLLIFDSGVPSLWFDGVDDYFLNPSLASSALEFQFFSKNQFDIVTAVQTATFSMGEGIFGTRNTIGTGNVDGGVHRNILIGASGGAYLTDGTATTNPEQWTLASSSGTTTLRVGQVQVGTWGSSFGTPSPPVGTAVGCLHESGVFLFFTNGYIKAILFHASPLLDDATRDLVETYVQAL